MNANFKLIGGLIAALVVSKEAASATCATHSAMLTRLASRRHSLYPRFFQAVFTLVVVIACVRRRPSLSPRFFQAGFALVVVIACVLAVTSSLLPSARAWRQCTP